MELKILVVYYSLEGNTKFIAQSIAKEAGADLLELEPQKSLNPKGWIKFFLGGKQVVRKEKPTLKPLSKNPNDYQLIFFGSPVWAGSFAPAFNTFFAHYPLERKEVAFFCSYKGSEGKTLENFRKALADNDVLGEIGFKNPFEEKEETVQQVGSWVKEILGSKKNKS